MILHQHRVGANLVDNRLDASEQSRIVQRGLAHGDPVLIELARRAQEARGVRECPDGDRAVIGGHATEAAAGNQGCACP